MSNDSLVVECDRNLIAEARNFVYPLIYLMKKRT